MTMASAATVTIRPDGPGYWRDWTNAGCGSGFDEWMCVDEDPASTADYLHAAQNQKETFNFGGTGLTTQTINSVTLYYYAMQHQRSQNSCFEAMARSGGTDYFGGTAMCGGASWGYVSHTFTTNPATGQPWTVAQVDALEAGMRGTGANNGGRVAQVYAVVDYNPLFPDLTIQSLTFSEYNLINNVTQMNDTWVQVTTQVKNIGTGTAGISTTRLAGLSTEDAATNPLSAGASQYFLRTYLCTSAHTYTSTADWNGVVTESNEGNNAASASIDCVV